MGKIVILKTDAATLPTVIQYGKHACAKCPSDLSQGDVVLLYQTLGTLDSGQEPIRYSMEFVASYPDESGESIKIWGKKWSYIIVGRNIRQLNNPFDIDDIKISSFNYRGAQWLAYVRSDDVGAIEENGYLDGQFV